MKHIKILGLAALASLALTAVTATIASATTLEVGGMTRNQSTTFTGKADPTVGTRWSTTAGATINTCLDSEFHAAVPSPYSGEKVEAPVSSLTTAFCEKGTAVVDNPGKLVIVSIPSSTNGTVFWDGAEITIRYVAGFIPCKTNGKHVGTLEWTGASTHSTLNINAVLDCSAFFLPTAVWKGTYTITGPTGLGVSP